MDYNDENIRQEVPVQDDPFSGFESGKKQGRGNRPPRRKKPHRSIGKIVAICLACALVGTAAGSLPQFIHSVAGAKTSINVGSRTPTQLDVVSVDTNREMNTAEIYNAYVGSCVGITVDIVSTNIFGQTVTGAAAGSGFVITEDGYILTNYHVIEDANAITVTFVDGTTYTATYVGGEERNDIAVIKIDATGLTPVVIGSSDAMLVGEQVTTIGNPLGELTFSESTGIISAKDRTVTVSEGQKMNMLQTDCAINSGNSGGPLFNNHGEVIGIVSAKYSSSAYTSAASIEGLGFAIPMDDIAAMVSDLVTNGYVTGKPFMGVSIQTVNSTVQSYGLPAGAEIKLVLDGYGAAKAGLQESDIITALGDTEIASSDDLISALGNYGPGDTVAITVYRGGKTISVNVTLDEATPENTQKLDEAIREYTEKQQAEQKQQQQNSWGGGSQSPWGSWPFNGFFY